MLAAIIDSSDDAIVSKDLNGIITSWNKGAERLFGYTAEEAVGRSITMLIPEDRQEEEPHILSRIRRGERVDHFETIRVRKDGRKLHISLTISPVKNANGEIVGASKIARDITEQQMSRQLLAEQAEQLRKINDELELRVQQRTEELLRAVEQLQGFTYSIAHDLRQSIRGIVIGSQMICDDYSASLADEAKEELERLADAGKRLSQLVDDLLRYARVADLDPKREAVDVTELARSVACDCMTSHEDVDVTVQEGMVCFADPGLLRLVLENLVDNACKYKKPGQRATVHIGFKEGVFFVRDAGIGFSQSYAERVFEPFERLHGMRYQGSGIGLANAKRVIERHGGRIWAESSPGAGATFYFTIGDQAEDAA